MEEKTFKEIILGDFEWLHRHPELGLVEYHTTEYIREMLSGIEGVRLLDDMEAQTNGVLTTGVLAEICGDKTGPVVAIRADIDALPLQEDSGVPYSSENEGCMHACGHDFHTAMLLGTARLLAEMREVLPGKVILLFQPGEEGGRGAERMVDAGIVERLGLDKTGALHVRPRVPVGTVFISPGAVTAAVDRFKILIKGVGSHGCQPHVGLDPIVAASRLVLSIQEIVSRFIDTKETAVVSVTKLQAGTGWNIISENAEIEGTTRTHSQVVRERVYEVMKRKVDALKIEGYEVEFGYRFGCPSTNNDAKIAALIAETAKEKGYTVVPQEPEMGGEDFAQFQKVVPGAIFHIGVGGEYPVHSPCFKADPEALVGASKLMHKIVWNMLES